MTEEQINAGAGCESFDTSASQDTQLSYWERRRRWVGRVGSSSTSETNLIWFQLSHLSGMWGFDFCMSVVIVILYHV